MKRMKVSLAIIAKNEEKKIERCIRSVPFADEVIVLDSGSSDRTPEIAKRAGAKYFDEPWRGFRDQKQHAVDLCQHDWIISLDADEALSPELCREIEQLLKSPDLEKYDGYEMPRLSYHLGRWIRHGGWYPDRQLRLFNRKRARWEGGEHVHERVKAEHVGELRGAIYHWPFDDLSEQINTNNRYSSLGASELLKKGKSYSFVRLVLKPISKFIECYILKAGFLDGLPGFIIAVGAGYSVFLKYSKAWEIQKLSHLENGVETKAQAASKRLAETD